MSDFQHLAVGYQDVDELGKVAIATILREKLLDELLIREVFKELDDLLAFKPAAIIVSFESVQLMSSTAIGQLVRLWKQAKIAETRLILAELNEAILEGFQVTHLDKQFEINTSVSRAIRLLGFPGNQ